jgi:hypothetical protein
MSILSMLTWLIFVIVKCLYWNILNIHISPCRTLNRSTYLIYTLTMTKINQVNIPNINISPWRRSTMSTYLIQTFHYDEDQPGQHISHRDQGGQHIQYRYVTMTKINQVNWWNVYMKYVDLVDLPHGEMSIWSMLTWLIFLVVKCLY